MQYRLVALLLQLPQHPSYLPFADVHFRCRLSARDQPLGGFLQHYQTVSLPLGHSQNSWFFHSPSVTLSSGHFYLAQTGHYHVAATSVTIAVDRSQIPTTDVNAAQCFAFAVRETEHNKA